MKVVTGTSVQAGTGKSVNYVVDYRVRETTGTWGAEVVLANGALHKLRGGVIANVTDATIAQAVTLALNAEIDGLDLDALNRKYGV